jgi:hypothetical protein
VVAVQKEKLSSSLFVLSTTIATFPQCESKAEQQQKNTINAKETKEKHNTTQQHCTLHNNTSRINEKIVLFIHSGSNPNETPAPIAVLVVVRVVVDNNSHISAKQM